jgi:hypothetical protein
MLSLGILQKTAPEGNASTQSGAVLISETVVICLCLLLRFSYKVHLDFIRLGPSLVSEQYITNHNVKT